MSKDTKDEITESEKSIKKFEFHEFRRIKRSLFEVFSTRYFAFIYILWLVACEHCKSQGCVS